MDLNHNSIWIHRVTVHSGYTVKFRVEEIDFIVLGTKVSYKLGCFLNSRPKFLKSFLANEALI